jgi:hypothetical protein
MWLPDLFGWVYFRSARGDRPAVAPNWADEHARNAQAVEWKVPVHKSVHNYQGRGGSV